MAPPPPRPAVVAQTLDGARGPRAGLQNSLVIFPTCGHGAIPLEDTVVPTGLGAQGQKLETGPLGWGQDADGPFVLIGALPPWGQLPWPLYL